MPAVSDALEIKVLGPVEVSRGGERVLRRAPLQRRLLAALLSGWGRPVSVDSLVDAMWGADAPADARSSLMVSLHRLRRALGDPRKITHEAGGYLIQVTADEFDAKAFEESVAAARKARSGGRLERSAADYAAALRLWRGDPYADIPALGLVAREAHRLEEERLLVSQERFEVSIDLGTPDPLIGEIEELARSHPFRERLAALRMLAMYRLGRQAEALQVFHESRGSLREELGIDPGPLLQRVHEAVLRSDERLDGLATESLDGEWAPLDRRRADAGPAAPASPRELPADAVGFTGREAALTELDAARLGSPDEGIPPAAVVVIAGMAGVGKTSAAVHWAHRIASEYPDGQLFVNLRGFSAEPALRPIEALGSLLRSLGLTGDQVPTAPDEAAARLRTVTAGKRVLILLDNASAAEQVIPLLPGGSGSLVIVTSRNQLGDLLAQHSGFLLELAPLIPAEAERLLKTLLRMPRSSDQPEIGALAERCGYLPLALRIAAASLTGRPHLGLAEYTRRLAVGSQVSTLRIGDSPATAVRATFDHSYTALPDEVRNVFRLIGIAPVRSLAVQTVSVLADLPMEDTERAVEHLVNAHVINRDGRGRFSLHDLIRDYAGSLVEAGAPERLAALRRLFDWYVGMAGAACELRYPGHARLAQADQPKGPLQIEDAAQAANWLDDERENLLAVARHAADHGEGAVAWKLADILRVDAWMELSGADFLALGHTALKGAREARSPAGEAAAELGLATACRRVHDTSGAIRHAERAIELAQQVKWDAGLAAALSTVVHACMLTGRLREALAYAQRALAMTRADGRLRAQSVNLGSLGVVRGHLGDLRQKMLLHAAGLRIAEAVGSAGLQAAHLRNLVKVALDLGLLDRAEEYLDRAMRLEPDKEETARVLRIAAHLYAARGEHDTALRYAESALSQADEPGYRQEHIWVLTAIAMVLNRLGRHGEAVAAAGRGLHETAADVDEGRIEALLERAVGRIELGEIEAAKADAATMLALAREGGFRIGEGLALNVAAEAAIRSGEPSGAHAPVGQALEIFRRCGHRAGESWSLWLLGAAARAEGDRVARDEHWSRVEQIHQEIGAPLPARFKMDRD